jgi:hypothetical protein
MMLTENDGALLAAALTTIEKLRQDLADTERDIAFQEMRAEIIRDTLVMLTGGTPAEPRQRQTRKRRADGAAQPPAQGLVVGMSGEAQ